MRMMMRVSIPVEAGNKAVPEGTAQAVIHGLTELVEVEAVYIGPDAGKRRAMIFFDLKDSSDIPAITEPFFQKLNASVELLPVMNQQDMMAGIAKLG
jgi:hypothetical protein